MNESETNQSLRLLGFVPQTPVRTTGRQLFMGEARGATGLLKWRGNLATQPLNYFAPLRRHGCATCGRTWSAVAVETPSSAYCLGNPRFSSGSRRSTCRITSASAPPQPTLNLYLIKLNYLKSNFLLFPNIY